MEIVIPFPKTDFSPAGTELLSGRNIVELLKAWESAFHSKFNPYYANVLECHPLAMHRLTLYFGKGEESGYDFGMELVDGNIDIDANLEMDDHLSGTMVYAIGSQIHDDEENPLLLVKNPALKDDILVLRYEPDDEGEGDYCHDPVNKPGRVSFD